MTSPHKSTMFSYNKIIKENPYNQENNFD